MGGEFKLEDFTGDEDLTLERTISPTRARQRQMLFGFGTPDAERCSAGEKEITSWPSPALNVSPGARPSAPRHGRRQHSSCSADKVAEKVRDNWQVLYSDWQDWQVEDVELDP